MNELRLSQAAELIQARHVGADARFVMVSTDSRSLEPGALFVAIQGPSFDGHDYLGDAQERGAIGAMVSRRAPLELPLLQVDDTRLGLRLAREGRRWRAWLLNGSEEAEVPQVSYQRGELVLDMDILKEAIKGHPFAPRTSDE